MDACYRYHKEILEGPTLLQKGEGGPLDEPLESMTKKYSVAASATFLR